MGRENLTGAWSEGTLRSEDIIPTSLLALTEILSWHEQQKDANAEEIEKARREIEQIEKRQTAQDYHSSEDASLDLEELGHLLNNFAPDGYYWGAHEGDGALIGFWEFSDS